MKSGINAVAARSGVSKSTVSRVLNKSGYVSDDVAGKVHKAARELNYFPRQTIARKSVAIVTDSGGSTYETQGFGAFLAAILAHRLNQAGYQALFIELKNIVMIHQAETHAVIVISDDGPGSLAPLKDLKIPVITVNEKSDGLNSICTDHAGGVELAVEELVGAGHTDIGLLLDCNGGWAGTERICGYGKALRKHNIKVKSELIVDLGKFSLVEAVAMLLRRNADALIACGEALGLRVAYALELLGKKIPEDISVISSEKYDTSRWLTPPHTTIDQNISLLVDKLMALVEKLAGDKADTPKQYMLESKLIRRQSIKNIKN